VDPATDLIAPQPAGQTGGSEEPLVTPAQPCSPGARRGTAVRGGDDDKRRHRHRQARSSRNRCDTGHR